MLNETLLAVAGVAPVSSASAATLPSRGKGIGAWVSAIIFRRLRKRSVPDALSLALWLQSPWRRSIGFLERRA